MALNTLQKAALKAVVKSKHQVVILTGEGGSGKTYTTQAILKAFKGAVALTATTNKAKEVLANHCCTIANTVQSETGYNLVRHNYKLVLMQVREYFSQQLLIVDEVSMLPKDVYDTIMQDIKENSNHKVLFLGDRVQLPAIGEGVEIDKIPGKQITLIEQQRQQSSSHNLKAYLVSLRSAILQGTEAPDLSDIPEITVLTSHREFCRIYNKTEGCKKVIAYRNAVVDKYNQHIHNKTNRFNPGDDVVIDKPIIDNQHNNAPIAKNGDTVHIVEVNPHPELPFDYITVVTPTGYRITVHSWYNTTARNDYLITLKGKRNDKYWEYHDLAIGLKHLYACTVHKTQGSTYDTVFLDGADLWSAHTVTPNKYNNPISYEMFLRLQYVAISRMTTHCYMYIGNIRYYHILKESHAN